MLDEKLYDKSSPALTKQINEFYDFSPICYVLLDAAYAIKTINLASAELLGFDRKLLLNKSFLNYVSYHSQLIFCNQLHFVSQAKGREQIEIEIIQRGGKRCYVSVVITPLEPDLYLLTIQDITYLRQLEIKNIESQRVLFLLENLFQNSAEAKAVLDMNFYFIKFNQSFVKSFSQIFSTKVSVNMNFKMLVADFKEIKQEILTALNNAAKGTKSFIKIENKVENKSTYYYFELFFVPLRGSESIDDKIIFIIRNLSAHKFNQRLHIKQQNALNTVAKTSAIGEMAAAFSHEINQPLAAISLFSQGCLHQFKDQIHTNAKLLHGLEQIHKLSLHAGEVLHRMKNFIREGKLMVEKNNVNMLIKELLNILEYQKMSIQYHLVLDDSLPLIDLDKVKFMQVLLNLAQNSIEAAQLSYQNSLEITIQTRRKDEYIQILFQDNGPGIPIEIENKIMNSYFTTKEQGTGLGLAICRTIVEGHGGKMFIDQSILKGACIIFILPVDSVDEKNNID